jgi:glucan phosphoethanolaminetransferase (alkaline phosphatase superfamily)
MIVIIQQVSGLNIEAEEVEQYSRNGYDDSPLYADEVLNDLIELFNN